MAGKNGHNKGGVNLADPSANPAIVGGGGVGLFKDGELEAQLQNVEQTSMANYFIDVGKDARSLFARTRVKDDNEINKCVLYYARCQKWGIKNGMEMLQNKLAFRKSIGGLSMDQILQLGTGQLRQNPSPLIEKKNKKDESEDERP